MPADPPERPTMRDESASVPDTEVTAEAAAAQVSEHEELDEPAETPFDHPLFLPAILAGLWVWFGYDGFLNQDPKMLEHVTFNRTGFAVLSVATAWFGYKAWKELSERKAERDDASQR